MAKDGWHMIEDIAVMVKNGRVVYAIMNRVTQGKCKCYPVVYSWKKGAWFLRIGELTLETVRKYYMHDILHFWTEELLKKTEDWEGLKLSEDWENEI